LKKKKGSEPSLKVLFEIMTFEVTPNGSNINFLRFKIEERINIKGRAFKVKFT